MKPLIDAWRKQALANCASNPAVAGTFRACADELEQAWHEQSHGLVLGVKPMHKWQDGCTFCERERRGML